MAMYLYPLEISFGFTLMKKNFSAYDANGIEQLHAIQQPSPWMPLYAVYNDGEHEVFKINGDRDRFIDLSMRYYFTDSQNEVPLGSVKKNASFWQYLLGGSNTRYLFYSSDGVITHNTSKVPRIKSGGAGGALLRFFTGYQSGCTVYRGSSQGDGSRPVMHLTKEHRYKISLEENSIAPEEEMLLLLGLFMIALTEKRSRDEVG